MAATYAKSEIDLDQHGVIRGTGAGEGGKRTSADFLRGHLDRLVGVAKVDLDNCLRRAFKNATRGSQQR